MAWPCARRCMTLTVVILLACGSAGCPKLNRWPGPTQDPFFSIADPIPASKPSTAPASEPATGQLQQEPQGSADNLRKSGKLPDKARRP